mgnify:CR=1
MTIITNITKTKNFLSKRFDRRYEKFCIFIALGLSSISRFIEGLKPLKPESTGMFLEGNKICQAFGLKKTNPLTSRLGASSAHAR